LSNIIRATLSSEPVRIGESRDDRALLALAALVLAEEFPDVGLETAVEGFRYIPLKSAISMTAALRKARELSHTEGFQAGHAEGLAEGRRLSQKAFDEFAGATKSVLEQRDTLLREAEQGIRELTLKIARKVTFDAANIDPEVTAAVIKAALTGMRDTREVKIKVSPTRLAGMQSRIAEFSEYATSVRALTIEADPRCHDGGCYLETPGGDIDARLDSQFKVIEEIVRTEG